MEWGMREQGEQGEAGAGVFLERGAKFQPVDLTLDSRLPLLPTMEGLWQLTLGWQPDEPQQAQLQQLYAFTLAGNRQFNLTRITEPEEFWEKHLWDSLRGVQRFLQGEGELGVGSWKSGVGGQRSASTPHPSTPSPFKVIDIGTGAGFPGVARGDRPTPLDGHAPGCHAQENYFHRSGACPHGAD